jgi:DNA-binding transcriptional LysR family regulator
MELRHLRYFVAVAEERHFRNAAARLHVAQPAISEQIRKLEQELGVQLFTRTHRRVELTEAGTVLLADAKRVLKQTEAATRAVHRVRDGMLTRLRIGYAPDAVPAAMPRALARLRTLTTPAPVVELSTGGARELLADVRGDRLDAALIALPAPLAGLKAVEVAHERAVAAIPEALIARGGTGPITLDWLARHRIVVASRATNPAFYDAVVGTFRAAELTPHIITANEPSPEHLLLESVAGAGVALLPGSVAERVTVPEVAIREIAGPAPSCTVAVAVRDEAPSTALTGFLRAIGAAARTQRRREDEVVGELAVVAS